MAEVGTVVVPVDLEVNMQDQENCEACKNQVERECDFHLGFNVGWDLCGLMMKTFIDNGFGE